MSTINLAQSLDNSQIRQQFDYLFVLDFEATCWNAEDSELIKYPKKKIPNEIIEFSLVLWDIKGCTIVAEFQEYVQPTENPLLSKFCTSLTGITQNQVTGRRKINECLDVFSIWFADIVQRYNIVLPGGLRTNRSVNRGVFVTWSNWDLSICLPHECNRKGLVMPEIFRHSVDLRAVYIRHYNKTPKRGLGLQGALDDCGMFFVGRPHSGINDARNTAYMARQLIKDGCVIV